MKRFSISLDGRIRNFSLPKNQPLIPLMEAIVNSIHAIEERVSKGLLVDASTGIIDITVKRKPVFDEIPVSLAPIEGFIISDNGIGFDENNLKSFLESDSTYKRAKGGKGVGRFAWLKAFDSVEIKSTFVIETNPIKLGSRQFHFVSTSEEIDDSISTALDDENKTTVELKGFKPEYQKNTPKQLESIALRIVQHCLMYFLSSTCPIIHVHDDENSISLNQLYKEKYSPENNAEQIFIKNEKFQLVHVIINEAANTGNHLYLCANSRLVNDIDLSSIIPDLDDSLYKKHNVNYVGVMTGQYLDQNVDMNRLSFSIPKQENDLTEDVSLREIQLKAGEAIERHLSNYIEPIREEKQKRILQYVTDYAPQFRHLLKYMPDDIKAIHPAVSDDVLDDELHKVKRKFDREVRKSNKELLHELSQELISDDEYQRRFALQVEKISDANQAELANYVIHRRTVLDLLEKHLYADDNGKYDRESCIHKLIFPMQRTIEDVAYESHNLWIIDERLAYSQFIASDLKISKKKDEERPDILLTSGPVAISDEENEGKPFSSITIFELKKPMRNDYSGDQNPIDQMMKYVEKLRTQKVLDTKGRIIHVGNETMFYLYAICDVTATLETILYRRGFTKMADGLGYYWHNSPLNAYIEVLPFNKILIDSKKRNKILFDKLGIE